MNNDKTVIVGVSCRLPGIDSLNDLWNCFIMGKSVITKNEHRYTKQYVGGFIDNIGNFDANFFNISPREAVFMDPQIRILLEKVQHAIENSTLSIKELQKLKCGVFVTALPGDYKYLIEKSNEHNHFGFSGNSFSSLSGKISFFYNFTGPSISIDTACSSGLYALQAADLNLQSNQCQAAIVGGITLFSTDEIFSMLHNSKIYSQKGTCLPFCKNADGLVPSEACVCLILTKQSIATELNLPVFAEIEKVKVNHDGYKKGFMYPNALSQADLLNEIYSEIDPNQLAYLETHGTGTIVGDESELKSLHMGIESKLNKPLILGTSKSLVGHSLVTSGLVSVIKAILCLKSSTIPKTYYLKNQTLIDKISLKFKFNTDPEYIDKNHSMVGVSAFGFTGSNGHVVLKRAEKRNTKSIKKISRYFIFPVSAKSNWSLINILKDIQKNISQNSDLEQLESLLQCSLNTFRIRITFIASSLTILCNEINDFCKTINEKSKIQNRIIDESNSLIDENELNMLNNWIDFGDDKLFASCDRKFDKISYRIKYPFHEQCLWIDEKRKEVTPSNDASVEILQQYLSLDDGFISEQVRWVKSTPESKNHIILLPPLNGDYKMWFFQIRKFTQEKFQLHIPFYPQHGRLSQKSEKIDFELLIEEIYQYITYIKKSSDNIINVIGWSIGGCFASLLGIKYPNILDRMCLVSTAANFSSDVFERTLDIQEELIGHLEKFQIIYEKNGSINELLSSGASMKHLKYFYDFLEQFDISTIKGGFGFPCLVIYGGKDVIISQEKTNELVQILHAQKVKFPNDGHFIPLTNPILFNDIILNFLQRRSKIYE